MYYLIYQDIAGYWRWTLYAANYKKVANSGEGFLNKTDCIYSIKLVKSSESAPIKD